MKTRHTIIISGTVILAVFLFYIFITFIGFPFYNEGIVLIRFSDDQFQKYQEEYPEYINIVKITDDDLTKVPAIKQLIEESLQKEFPKNRTGKVLSNIDTLMENHNYYSKILAEKYSKDPSKFFINYGVESEVLEDYPNAVRVDFQARYFEYDGQQYGYGGTRVYLNYEDNLAIIEANKVNNPLDPQRHIWAELADKDLDNMPTLREAIDNIGKFKENIEVQTGLSNAELNSIQKWNESVGFGSNRATAAGSVMEYNGENYQIGFWIA